VENQKLVRQMVPRRTGGSRTPVVEEEAIRTAFNHNVAESLVKRPAGLFLAYSRAVSPRTGPTRPGSLHFRLPRNSPTAVAGLLTIGIYTSRKWAAISSLTAKMQAEIGNPCLHFRGDLREGDRFSKSVDTYGLLTAPNRDSLGSRLSA